MEFLPDDYEHDEYVSMYTLEKLDTMIRVCSLDGKQELINRMQKLTLERDAMEMIAYLRGYMPIPGIETTPHSVKEQGEAIKLAVDKDDFYEQRFNKDKK